MGKLLDTAALIGCLAFSGCGGGAPDSERGEDVDTSGFTTSRTGRFLAQDEPATSGAVHIRADEAGTRYLVLADDFRTAFHTGSVAFYLAATTSNLADQRDADAQSVSPRIGRTSVIGAQAFTIPEEVDDTSFGAVIVYCEPVGVNFGAASLQ